MTPESINAGSYEVNPYYTYRGTVYHEGNSYPRKTEYDSILQYRGGYTAWHLAAEGNHEGTAKLLLTKMHVEKIFDLSKSYKRVC